jgi:hypothetical protein
VSLWNKVKLSKILKNEIKTVAICYKWSIINIKANSISKLEI